MWSTSFLRYLCAQVTEQKGRNSYHTLPTKKRRNPEDKDKGADGIHARRNLVMEADKEELISLGKQVEDLHKTIQEKDEILQSFENLNSHISCVQEELVGLKHQSAEKDALLKATHLQLSDMKVSCLN